MRTFLVRKSEVGTGTRAVRSKMATFIRLQDSAGQNLENCVLILPSVSVGNVPQLCVDLLISTYRMKKIGYLHHPSILPLVGVNAYDHSKDEKRGCVHTSCEVFFHPTPGSQVNGWAVVQFRAPLCKGGSTSFCDGVLEWMGRERFSLCVMLTSIKAEQKLDVHIQGQSFSYLNVTSQQNEQDEVNSKLQERVNSLGWPVLKEAGDEGSPKEGEKLRGSVLSGSGFAKKMYQKCLLKKVQLLMVAMYCNQGDNTGDAISFISQLVRILVPEEETPSWILPRSWSYQFGPPPPDELYS